MQQRPFYIPGLSSHYFIEKATLSLTLKAFLGKYDTEFSPLKVSELGTVTTSPRCNFKGAPGFPRLH